MAAATISMLPVLILYFFAQRQFIEGIATTGLKG
jgi:multiple sugar transport system permease protein